MTKRNKCPICSSTVSQTLLSYDAFPYFTVPVSRLLKEKILEEYTDGQLTAPLNVKVCGECCHCYLAILPNQEIIDNMYSNYFTYPSALESHFQPERDDRFLEFFGEKAEILCKSKKLNSILEIGCYDGYILHGLQQKGFTVTGCDPSEGADIGRKHGLKILREYFNPELFAEKGLLFDIIISRHFIEHTVNPLEWLKDLSMIMNKGGFIILETPNVQFYLKEGLLEVFSLQHLHGFSPYSLDYAMNEAELKVVKMEKTPSNLITIVEKGVYNGSDRIKSCYQITNDFYQEYDRTKLFLKEIAIDFSKKKVLLWGAGSFAIAAITLYGIPLKNINSIIDSDQKKWGMEYLHNSLQIISPAKAKQNKPDLIIITSMYSQTIKKQISEMKFKCNVLSIFPMISYDEL